MEEYLKMNKLTKRKALSFFIKGVDHKLFEVEHDVHIKEVFNMKSQKNEFNRLIKIITYRVVYYLFLFCLFLFVVFGVRDIWFFIMILSILPISRYFSLDNKISQYNINLYNNITNKK